MQREVRSNSEKKLYAIAFEERRIVDRKVIVIPGLQHVHAFDSQNAKVQFLQDVANRHLHVVAVGPVVGFLHGNDHGEFRLA